MTVADIWDDALEIFGACPELTTYRRINDSIELLVNKGDWQPLYCYLDVCATGRCVALPSEVETPIAAIIDGHPAVTRNELYRYHINGPGERYSAIGWEWDNVGVSSTMRDPIRPCRLVARVELDEDTGSALWAYGYDEDGRWIRTKQPDDTFADGYQVPTIAGWALSDADAPRFGRITAIRKAKTEGRIRLCTSDWKPSTSEGQLLGEYLPHEVEPRYRRVRLSREADWVRFYVRRKSFAVSTMTDFIPLHSSIALKLGMRAIKGYNDRDIAMAMDYEAAATRLLSEREAVVTPPGGLPVQIDPGVPLVDNLDEVN